MKIQALLKEAGQPFITDEHRHNEINLDTLREYIATRASKAFNAYVTGEGTIIYRGIEHNHDDVMFIQDTYKSERKSENTSNVTTVLTAMLPSWKDLPPRSKTIPCSTDKDMAYSYGRAFVVLPFDNGSTCVYTGVRDFWEAFPRINQAFPYEHTVDELNRALHGILGYLQQQNYDVPNKLTTPDDIEQFCSVIDKVAGRSALLNERFKRALQPFIDSQYNSYFEYLNWILDPSHFTVTQNGEILKTGDQEVGVAGKIILVHQSLFHELVAQLKK